MKSILLASILSIFLLDGSIYDFKITTISEYKKIDLSTFRGKKLLIVNIACKSPYSFQLEELEELYKAYAQQVIVIGFPCGDDFGNQELKTNKDIRSFCHDVYGITFPISEKTAAIGSSQHPVFKFLVEEAKKMGMEEPVITWNFTKFLIDESGNLVKVFPPDVAPLNQKITSLLNDNLSKKSKAKK
jgi:glutathione peroxidase